MKEHSLDGTEKTIAVNTYRVPHVIMYTCPAHVMIFCVDEDPGIFVASSWLLGRRKSKAATSRLQYRVKYIWQAGVVIFRYIIIHI